MQIGFVVLVAMGHIAAIPILSDRANCVNQALVDWLAIVPHVLVVHDYHEVFVLAIETMVTFNCNVGPVRVGDIAGDVLSKLRVGDLMIAAGTVHAKPNELRIGAIDGKVDRPIVLVAGSLLEVLK